MLINSYMFGIPWTPAAIATALWLDAADASTITASSGRISQWADKSGNTRNASQATAAQQPKVVMEFLNSRNVVEFDPTGSGYQRLSFSQLNNYEHLFFVAFKNNVDSYEAIFSSTVTDQRSVYVGAGTGSNLQVQNITPVNGGFTRNSWHIGEVRADGTTATIGVDGTRVSAADADKMISAEIGYYTNTSQFISGSSLRGKVAEIILLSAALTDANRQKVEGYLAHKWGLTANLPSDHPYKSAPPFT